MSHLASLCDKLSYLRDTKKTKVASKVRKIYRSSHRMCSVKKGVLKNATNLTGKHLCLNLLLIKLKTLFLLTRDSNAGAFLLN